MCIMKFLSIKEIKVLCQKNFGINVSSIQNTTTGVSSLTHKIESKTGTYYFKQNSRNLILIRKIQNYLEGIGVPTSQIIASNEHWMLLKEIVGKKLSKQYNSVNEIDDATLERIGVILGTINSIKTTGFGPLNSQWKGEDASYHAFSQDILLSISEKYRGELTEYVNSIRAKDTFLNHGDICLGHLFLDSDTKKLTVLDFDDVLSAPHYYDLAEFSAGSNFTHSKWESLMLGYTQKSTYIGLHDRRLLLEMVLILVDSIQWYKNKHNTYKTKIYNDTKRLSSVYKLLDKYR